MRRRLLPESAYDFWVRDGRDGETSKRRPTLAAAEKDLAAWRAGLHPWSRGCLALECEINERKVLRLLRDARTVR